LIARRFKVNPTTLYRAFPGSRSAVIEGSWRPSPRTREPHRGALEGWDGHQRPQPTIPTLPVSASARGPAGGPDPATFRRGRHNPRSPIYRRRRCRGQR